MTSAEVNYAQIEKEMLSIVFAAEKFHQYIYGKGSVTVESDHKPIEAIMQKPLNKAPPRLQRLMLRLQHYNLQVKFVPGKFMYVADTLSRAYLPAVPDIAADNDMGHVVHTLTARMPVTAAKWTELKEATARDAALQKFIRYCRSGWPRTQRNLTAEARPYWNIREDTYEAEGIVFTGDRIVVPASLRQYMLDLIHESHLGMEKCKNRAREIL